MDGDFSGVINSETLRGYCARRCSLLEDRDALNEEIRVLDNEVKDAGFDKATFRQIVREMRTDPEARNAHYALVESYRRSLGLYDDTPLGQATLEREEREQPRRRRRRAQPLDDVEPAGQA